MGKRNAGKAQLWATQIAAFQASGQSRRSWCTTQGVNIHTLDYWRLKLRPRAASKQESARPGTQRHQPPASAIALVPVQVRSGSTPAPCASSTAIELEWPNGLRLRTVLSANVQELSVLVRALWPC